MNHTFNRPKKVTQILYSGLGGHGSVAFSLAQAAKEAGRWSNSLVFMGVEPTLDSYRDQCRSQGYGFAEVIIRPRRAWMSWGRLLRTLDSLAPDAIVLHSVKAILPCAWYAWRKGIPLIAVEHQPNSLKSRAEWWVSRRLQQLAGAVVLLTPDYQRDLQAALGRAWRAEKIHLIANGIDTTLFSPAGKALDRTKVVIGMAARMTTLKRQELLIDALALLQSHSGAEWRLSLAGDGETAGLLKEKAEASGLSASVAFPGYLDEPALLAWFRTLDIYAHASNGETLSTSLLQAMALGLPIVGSDVPGISDLLEKKGGAGLLVQQSPDAFASAFEQLLADPGMRETLGHRARTLAESEFSQRRMFERYDELVGALCKR